MANNTLTKSEKDVTIELVKYFEDIYNRKVSVDWTFIANIHRKPTLSHIGRIINYSEIGICIFHLT